MTDLQKRSLLKLAALSAVAALALAGCGKKEAPPAPAATAPAAAPAPAKSEPLKIASTLVKVRRTFPAVNVNPFLTSGFMTGEKLSIEPRVKRLVHLADALPFGGKGAKFADKPFFEIVSVAALFAGSLFVIMFLAPLTVHRTAEILIGFIK